MHSRTVSQFTSLSDTVGQIRLEVHKRRPTVHLDKVLLLMAPGSPGDRPLTGGSIREGRAAVEMGRHCQSLGANDRVEGEGEGGGQNTGARINIPAQCDLHTRSEEGRA